MTRLRILCLHGFRGSGQGLRAQLQAWVAESSAELELICPDAPRLADGRTAWWNAVPIEGRAAPSKRYEGWQRTKDAITTLFEYSGPFDGVFGFSQGAALAGLLVGIREPSLQFGFVILVGGFVSSDPEHAALYATRSSYALPSLHLIGRADRVVPPEASHALAARFEQPSIVEHGGGHVIANTPEVRRALRAFLSASG